MGGGGGAYSFSEGELQSLEETAKKALSESEKPEKRNVFISFAYEDVQQVNLLRGQARNENSDIEFNDWSLREPFDSERAEYIRTGIRERINQCSVTLVYVSDDTIISKWVDWEIRESVRLGKAVVAVYSGTRPTRLPTALSEIGVSPIPWTHEGISQAIDAAAASRSASRSAASGSAPRRMSRRRFSR
jgi:hypothetical protein